MFSPKRLRSLRQERGWKVERLAAACSLSERSIYAYESGQMEPRANQVGRLAYAMGVEIGSLFENGRGRRLSTR